MSLPPVVGADRRVSGSCCTKANAVVLVHEFRIERTLESFGRGGQLGVGSFARAARRPGVSQASGAGGLRLSWPPGHIAGAVFAIGCGPLAGDESRGGARIRFRLAGCRALFASHTRDNLLARRSGHCCRVHRVGASFGEVLVSRLGVGPERALPRPAVDRLGDRCTLAVSPVPRSPARSSAGGVVQCDRSRIRDAQ